MSLLFFLPLTLPGLFRESRCWSSSPASTSSSLVTVVLAHLVYAFPYFLLIAVAALDRLDPSSRSRRPTSGIAVGRVPAGDAAPDLADLSPVRPRLPSPSFDEFIITFFVIGFDSTPWMFIWSSLRRTVDPSINTISTLLMAITLLLWVVASSRGPGRADRRRGLSGLMAEAWNGVTRLQIEGVTHRYGQVVALDDVSLDRRR